MKRKYRLRSNEDFQRVRRNGRFYASPLVVLAFLRNDLAYNRIGFVVSKRLGKAYQRNRIKRRMREIIRLHINEIKPGFDMVFIARQPLNKAQYLQIKQVLLMLLKKAKLRLQ